ncbi:FRG domain-containing protein [Enterococcus avium]|uniref:FRG domain-containing protein n=1 Tax=Enterococcus avium TaxID=33945 RepID=UPI0032E4A8D7
MKEITIKNFSELFNEISRIKGDYPKELIFRGVVDYKNNNQSNGTKQSDKLIPKIFRTSNNDSNQCYIDESAMINGVLSKLPNEFQGMSSNFEILLKLQHYGIPTRLIDVSFNPYVSTFFACNLNQQQKAEKRDGYLYILNKEKLEVKTVFSDKVAIVSAISRLDENNKKWLLENLKQYLIIRINLIKYYFKVIEPNKFQEFNKDRIVSRSSNLVLTESQIELYKNFFESKISIEDLHDVISSVIFLEELKKEGVINLKQKINELNGLESALLLFQITEGEHGKVDTSSLDSYQLHDQIYIANERLKSVFNKKASVQKLLHEVRNFRPGFRDNLDLEDLSKDYLVESLNSNSRISNQQGGFILLGLRESNDEYYLDEGIILEKWTIPNENISDILKDLDTMNINESFIYPELEHFNFEKYRENREN